MGTVLGVALSFIALVGYIVKISMDYAKLKTETENQKVKINILETNSFSSRTDLDRLINDFKNELKLNSSERKSNSEKFQELYNSRNKTNDTLVELSTTIKMFATNINQQFESLETKITELKQEIKENKKGQ